MCERREWVIPDAVTKEGQDKFLCWAEIGQGDERNIHTDLHAMRRAPDEWKPRVQLIHAAQDAARGLLAVGFVHRRQVAIKQILQSTVHLIGRGSFTPGGCL